MTDLKIGVKLDDFMIGQLETSAHLYYTKQKLLNVIERRGLLRNFHFQVMDSYLKYLSRFIYITRKSMQKQ